MSAPTPAGSAGNPPSNTLGLVGMILGIISIPLACCGGLGTVIGIAAVVLGFLGRQKADQGQATNRGQAQAAIWTGIAGVAIGLLWFIFVVALNVTNFGYNF